MGWAGLPPSIVERPEIVLEGVFEGDNNYSWTKLNFRWKPGNVRERPLQVAPHQPRYVPTYLVSTLVVTLFSLLLMLLGRKDWTGKCGLPLWTLHTPSLVFESCEKLLDNCGPVQLGG